MQRTGQMSELCSTRLTEETGQPAGLVVMNDGHAQRVESHQAQHRPVERLRLHHAADGDTQETLLTAEICRRTSFGAPDACSRHGDALGRHGETAKPTNLTNAIAGQTAWVLPGNICFMRGYL